jgi:hypothetical protein
LSISPSPAVDSFCLAHATVLVYMISKGQVPEGARTHAANLTGVFFGDVNVLCRAGFVLDAKHGVTLKIAVRSTQPQVNDMLTKVIR